MVGAAIVSGTLGGAVGHHFLEQRSELLGKTVWFRAARSKCAPRIQDILHRLVCIDLSLSSHRSSPVTPFLYHGAQAAFYLLAFLPSPAFRHACCDIHFTAATTNHRTPTTKAI